MVVVKTRDTVVPVATIRLAPFVDEVKSEHQCADGGHARQTLGLFLLLLLLLIIIAKISWVDWP